MWCTLIIPYSKMGGDIAEWGRAGWKFLHVCSFAYPTRPTPEHRAAAFSLVSSLRYMLPCGECRLHTGRYLDSRRTGIHSLDSPHLRSRESFARWLFDFHNSVNARLGYPVLVDYDSVRRVHSSPGGACKLPSSSRGVGDEIIERRMMIVMTLMLLALLFAACVR